MPKRKSQGKKQVERHAKAVARRERKAGLYCKPGDPDFKSLSEQLRVQGLALKDVQGDGNCLFRALAQQLDGSHSNLRQRAVEHIRTNSADYVPFMDEDTSFESYVEELSKDGTFAGNDAIVAVSRACKVNIVIHQIGAPRWEVWSPLPTDKTVHIAYLKGEHYCSVQPLRPAQTLPTLEARPQRQQQQQQQQQQWPAAAAKDDHGHTVKSDVDFVLEGTGCQDRLLAEQCLKESGGEISLAIVELLQLMTVMEENSGEGKLQVGAGEHVQQLSSAAPQAGTLPTTKNPQQQQQQQQQQQRHMSNKERKAAAKAAKKQAVVETRQRSKEERGSKSDGDGSKDNLGATAI